MEQIEPQVLYKSKMYQLKRLVDEMTVIVSDYQLRISEVIREMSQIECDSVIRAWANSCEPDVEDDEEENEDDYKVDVRVLRN